MRNIVMSWLNLEKSLHLIKLASVLFLFSLLRSCFNMVRSDKVILGHDTAGKSQILLKTILI